MFNLRSHSIIYIIVCSSLMLITSCNSESNSDTYWSENDRNYLIKGLEDSKQELMSVIDTLTEAQWNFMPNPESWSIARIVEHLGLQQDMHFREVFVLSKTPPLPDLVDQVEGNEIKILNYVSDITKGEATWNVEPLGRWCTKSDAINQFDLSRGKFIEFVKTTNADLKQHFTFRNLPDKSDYRSIRDLHQIVLTTITHTRRHIKQIEGIMALPDFPQ